MGLFDTIRATLPCPVCGSINEREIQTKKGPCALFDLEVGDTLEPFFYGDNWLEEDWDCDDCRERTQAETRWHKSFIHCINGLIVEVTPEKPPQGKLPDWDLIHNLSRDRHRYRQTLRVIKNSVLAFKEGTEAGERKPHPLLDFGPKTVDELLDKIVEHVEHVEKGEPPGLF